MKPIYHFDDFEPPKLTQRMLLEETSRRVLRRQTILLAIASFLANISIAILAFYIIRIHLLAGIICLSFFCLSLIGNGLISVLFIYQRRRNNHVIIN